MLDFNSADQQGSGTGGAIPPDSIIPFKMTLRSPKAGKEGTQHPLFCKSDKGNEYIDVEFEALGTYAGRKMWEIFVLYGNEKSAKISMRTLRAIIESARNINPEDPSPAAAAGRQLSDWADFNSMTFLAKVKCHVEQNQRDGQWYVNNELVKIITPDMPEYLAGEHISDKPLPPIPDGTAAPTAAVAAGPAAGGWGNAPGAPAAQQTGAPTTTTSPSNPAPAAPAGMPAWASK